MGLFPAMNRRFFGHAFWSRKAKERSLTLTRPLRAKLPCVVKYTLQGSSGGSVLASQFPFAMTGPGVIVGYRSSGSLDPDVVIFAQDRELQVARDHFFHAGTQLDAIPEAHPFGPVQGA